MPSNQAHCLLAAASAVATLAFAGTTEAGLFRAYVSVAGDDAHPCTLQQPCRLLPAALAAVNDGGEIWMLDSANFNTAEVIIAKSVSILAVPGAIGSVVGLTGNAVFINTAGVSVALRNLKILNLSNGLSGISMLAGARLVVDRCEISGFAMAGRAGIQVTADADVSIVDTIVRDNYNGISLGPGTAVLARVTSTGNSSDGVFVLPSTAGRVTVVDSVLNGNGSTGLSASVSAASRSVHVSIDRSTASNNGTAGYVIACTGGGTGDLTASGSTASDNLSYGFSASGVATMAIDRSVASGNQYGIVSFSSGAVAVSSSFASRSSGAGFAHLGSGKFTVSASTASSGYDGFVVLNAGTMTVSSSVSTGNTYGFRNSATGTFRSLGDNTVVDNASDTSGTITTVAPK
jgi:hypothetical protein